jgi:hypothetical protein
MVSEWCLLTGLFRRSILVGFWEIRQVVVDQDLRDRGAAGAELVPEPLHGGAFGVRVAFEVG